MGKPALNLSGDNSITLTSRAAFVTIPERAHAVRTTTGLEKSTGNWNFDAGDGADTINASALTGGNNVLSGGAGNDTITGGAGNDLITGGAGSDSLNGGSGNDTAAYAGSASGVIVNLQTGVGSGGDAAGDTLSGFESLVGSNLNDVLTGDANANAITGGGGADSVAGGGGDDALWGGDDADSLVGGDGNDYIYGEAGADTLAGDGGNDTLTGGDGNDALAGGVGGDTLYGDAGADTLDGGADNDLLIGSQGNDQYTGGAGDDMFVLNGDSGAETDTITDWGDGNDNFFYSEMGAGDRLNVTMVGTSFDAGPITPWYGVVNVTGTSAADTIVGGSGNDTINGGPGADSMSGGAAGTDTASYAGSTSAVTVNLQAGSASGGDAEGDTLVNFRNLLGSGGNDVLTGNEYTNILNGGAGADTLAGGDSSDWLYGDDGNDNIAAGDGNDWLYGNEGNDTLAGEGGYDDLFGGAGDDFLTGGDHEDALHGDAGNDTLNGGADYDALLGGAGNDQYTGGAGDDDFWLNGDLAAAETDTITDWGDGTDSFIDSLGEGDRLNVTMTGTSFDASGIAATDGMVNVTGSSAGDDIRGGVNGDTLAGGAGNDILVGGAGNDILFGGADADTLTGGDGNDSFVDQQGSTGLTLALADVIEDFATGLDAIYTTTTSGVHVQDGAGFSGLATFLEGAEVANDSNSVFAAWNAAGTGNAWVYVDHNGNTAVDTGDSIIVLTGINLGTELSANDFPILI